MKSLKNRVTVALALTMFFLLGFCGRPVMSAETYFGDLCWRIDITSPSPDSWTYKLGLYLHSGGHFTLVGTEGTEAAVHGNMEISGNNLLVNLVGKGTDSDGQWLDNLSATLSLNPPTLSGSCQNIYSWDGGSSSEVGTMTLIACP